MVGATERVQYALGYYYFEDDGSYDSYNVAASPLAGPIMTAYDNDTEANAVYAQATWTPPILDDRLAITLGYRHTEETKGITYRYLDDGTATGGGLFSGSELNLGVNLDYTGELFPVTQLRRPVRPGFQQRQRQRDAGLPGHRRHPRVPALVHRLPQRRLQRRDLQQPGRGGNDRAVGARREIRRPPGQAARERVDLQLRLRRHAGRDDRGERQRPADVLHGQRGRGRALGLGARAAVVATRTTCCSRPAGRTWTATSRNTRPSAARAPS